MTINPVDEALVTRVTAAVLRELGYVGRPPEREPMYVPDPEAREQILRCGRDTYRKISAEPDFPPAIMRGKTKMREMAKLKAFMARRQVT